MAATALVLDMTEAALAAHAAVAAHTAAAPALFDLVSMIPLTGFPQSRFLAGVAAGIARSAVVPRWLGVAALVPALAALVGAAGLGDPRGAVAAVALVGSDRPMLLWILATSIALFVRREGGMPTTGKQRGHIDDQRWRPKASSPRD